MVFLLYIAFNHTLDIMSRLIGCRPHVVLKCNPVSANRLFVAGYPWHLASNWCLFICFWPYFGRKRGTDWQMWQQRSLSTLPVEWYSMHGCVCTCMHQKWVTTLGQLQGNFELAIESEGRDREDRFEGQTPPCTVGHSLTFHCFHVSVIPFFPSSISISQHLHLIRRDSVSSWPVGTEQQPQWLEDCSSTTTKGRSSSPGSTEMTLGMFQWRNPTFLSASCKWQWSCEGE